MPRNRLSLGVNMILMALERQKKLPESRTEGTLILYGDAGRKKAYAIFNELREKGLVAELDISGMEPDKARTYAKARSMNKIIFVGSDDRIHQEDV